MNSQINASRKFHVIMRQYNIKSKGILLFTGRGRLYENNDAKLRDLFWHHIFGAYTGDGDRYVAIAPTNKVN